MLDFENIIVHILDSEHNACIMSECCIQDMELEVEKMLQTKAGKVFASAAKKKGEFKEGGHIEHFLQDYKEKKTSFEEMSKQIAQYIFDAKMKYALYEPTDLLLAEVLQEGRRYILGIENAYSEGVTHNLVHQGEDIVNEIIPYRTLLSVNLVKKDRAFLVELSDMSVHSVESKIDVETDKVNFYGDILLESTTAPSYKEAVTSISKVTEKLTEKFDLDEIEMMPRMKSIIKDNVESQTPINIEEVATLLFADKPLAKGEFKEELRTQGIAKDIDVEYVKSTKSEKVQKIKTDRGIEIIIPVDFMNSKDLVEFQNQPDGTISIQLKNIIHISSK